MKKMTKKEALKILIDHNAWRRGSKEIQMQDPVTLGKALDYAIKYMTEKQVKNG